MKRSGKLGTSAHPPFRARAAEQEAQLAARSAVRTTGQPRQLERSASGSTADPSVNLNIPGTGRKLTPGERSGFEAVLGHDFSSVRIHTGPDAAQAADEAGADAFTRGNHVVLGSGSGSFNPTAPAARELLAHELSHTAQPLGAEGATQRQPKDPSEKEHGIGSKPPAEPVEIAKGVAPEDVFVLFDQDQVSVSADSETTLTRFAQQYQKPVVVEIHGYASTEGDADYNSNLAGHRAVKIKQTLLSLLPVGSEVRLYANGETAAFGMAANNRRGAIHVIPGATPKPSGDGATDGTLPGALQGDPLGVQPSLGNKPFIAPHLDLSPGPLIPPGTQLPSLPALKDPTIDWKAMREPFTSRGLQLGERDADAITRNWMFTYNWLRERGLPPDLAAWGANHGTAYAYDKQLSLEAPNAADIFNNDYERWKAQTGKHEIKTPIIPIITPETLKYLTKKLFHKDISFEF